MILNGATVHWVKRYEDMIASNVISTIDAMNFCNEGKPVLQVYSIIITASNPQSNKSALAKTLSLRTMICRAVKLV